jgi:peroxiredoxin
MRSICRSCRRYQIWLVSFILIASVVTSCSVEKPEVEENISTSPPAVVPIAKSDNISAPDKTVRSAIAGFNVGAMAPDFTLHTIDNDIAASVKVTLSKMRGKNVLLNFWATWCFPCKQEFPFIDFYYKHNQRENLSILTVCSESSKLDINTYLLPMNYTVPVLVDGDGKIRRLYSNKKNTLLVIPTTFLIDSKGIVVKILRREFAGTDDIEANLNSVGF